MDYMLEARNVTRGFPMPGGETYMALKGVDLYAPTGKLTILKGRSGSGKTTLLNILSALDEPTGGQVILNGKDITGMSENARAKLRRKDVGYVFQSVALIPMMTALENVEFSLRLVRYKGDRRARAMECLRLVGLAQRAGHMPQEMSGGEQQRVAVAIALANNPKLLLADEPTGSVDAKTGAYILDVLRTINRDLGLTTVIVTHDPLLAKKVNRVVAIRDGKIASERIMKQSYLTRLEDIDAFTHTEDVQDEYAVLDRANRLQVPKEMLEKIGHSGNRLKVSMQDGKIILEAPDEN